MSASIVDHTTGCRHILPPPDFDDNDPWCDRLELANERAGFQRFRWYYVEFHRGGLH